MTVGENIRLARQSKKLTQQQLADKIGVKHSVISKYELGLIAPNTRTFKAIAEALDLSAEELIAEDDAYIRYLQSIAKNEMNQSDKYPTDEQLEILRQIRQEETASIDRITINETEVALLNAFYQLNESGKQEALKRISELAELSRYRKDG